MENRIGDVTSNAPNFFSLFFVSSSFELDCREILFKWKFHLSYLAIDQVSRNGESVSLEIENSSLIPFSYMQHDNSTRVLKNAKQ